MVHSSLIIVHSYNLGVLCATLRTLRPISEIFGRRERKEAQSSQSYQYHELYVDLCVLCAYVVEIPVVNSLRFIVCCFWRIFLTTETRRRRE